MYIYNIYIYIYIYGCGRLTRSSGGRSLVTSHVGVKIAWVGTVGWVGARSWVVWGDGGPKCQALGRAWCVRGSKNTYLNK